MDAMVVSTRPTQGGKNRTGSRTPVKPMVSDLIWAMIASFFAPPTPSKKGGRPRVDARQCLEGVLWILQTGARWKDLPERYPSPSTCWRRLKEWTESGAFHHAWAAALGRLDGLRGVDWEKAIADATFSPAKKGAPRSAPPRAAKARN